MDNRKANILFLFIAAVILFGCNPARKIPQGQYLLVKNKLYVEKKAIDADALKSYIRQKPNRKQWGTWLRVRIYNGCNKGKENKVKRWIKNTLGSEPVMLDTNLTYSTVKQLGMYLENKGYFHSEVRSQVQYKAKKKKAIVKYFVKAAQPYVLRNIGYAIDDATVKAFVYSDKARTMLRSGDQFDVDKLAAERERIAADLTNYGYYFFSQEYIKYRIDTSLNTHQADIVIGIADPMVPMPDNKDSVVRSAHKRYYINNIYICIDPKSAINDTVKYDTTWVLVPNRRKNQPPKKYYFVYQDKLRINPKTLTQQIFVDSGDYYCFKDIEKTHKQLYDLKTLRYVNILFNEPTDNMAASELLNCQILLSRLPIQAFAVEAQATNRGGDLGIAGNIVYENRNLFRGAEIINFKLNGAVEIEKLSLNTKKEDRAIEKIPFFNTVEAGADINVKIPRFLLPVRQERFSKNFRPKTNIGAGFNYQQRPDYTRYLTKGSYGFEWKESPLKTHILTPVEVNAVTIHPDSSFTALIDALPDKVAQNAYRNHLITSLKYSFIYNTQQLGKKQNFMYFRGNFEVAGLIFWLYSTIKGVEGSYLLLKTPYSQYTRVDFDYRYYAFINEKNSIATRAALGIGAPLNKFNSLPFEKSFYLGGANSMRGWRLRTLGPGSYDEPDSLNFDNIGDLGLELNFEYRFPIYKYFTGGFFIDAGNIWLRKKNELYPGGEFRFDRFYRELAFDAGLGLRLDFGFFLIRIDGAVPLKNPRLLSGERWIFQNHDRIRVLGNLGIGYPF